MSDSSSLSEASSASDNSSDSSLEAVKISSSYNSSNKESNNSKKKQKSKKKKEKISKRVGPKGEDKDEVEDPDEESKHKEAVDVNEIQVENVEAVQGKNENIDKDEKERLDRLSQNQALLKQLVNSNLDENPESIEEDIEIARGLTNKANLESEGPLVAVNISDEEDDDRDPENVVSGEQNEKDRHSTKLIKKLTKIQKEQESESFHGDFVRMKTIVKGIVSSSNFY